MLYSKILFYEWIKPCHLGISLCEEDLKNSLKLFQKSFSRPSVTEMISSFMDTMYYIYKSIGRESDHDVFFPTLTYLLIKSKRSDLEIFHTFITKYKRNKYPGCSLNCKHNQNLVCSCNAFKTYDDSEVSYYLVVYKASLEFITRMEFYDLNISVEEFNNLITKSSQNK